MNAIAEFYDLDQTQRLINRYDNPRPQTGDFLTEADGSRSNVWLIGLAEFLLAEKDIHVPVGNTPKRNAGIEKLTQVFQIVRLGAPFTHAIHVLYRELGTEGKLPELKHLTIYLTFGDLVFNHYLYPNVDQYQVNFDVYQFNEMSERPNFPNR